MTFSLHTRENHTCFVGLSQRYEVLFGGKDTCVNFPIVRSL